MTTGSSVARETVFVLNDGIFVVQRAEDQVQELLSGQYRNYRTADYGEAISDYELNQLQAAGRVERYTGRQVWLGSLPRQMPGSYGGSMRHRAFYLNTTLPRTRLEDVVARLKLLDPGNDFMVRVRGDMVAVLGRNGTAFRQLKDAELTQKYLKVKLPVLFRHTAIAFVETSDREVVYDDPIEKVHVHDLDVDASVTRGKRVLVMMSDAAEAQALHDLLCELDMDVTLAQDGVEGLHLLEDHKPDLLLMDVQLPDMHAWEVLAKLKEIGSFQDLLKIVLADHRSKSDDQAFALTVGRVDLYLARPISEAQLRRNIWLTLKNAVE